MKRGLRTRGDRPVGRFARRAFTIVEIAVALAILTVAIVAVSQLLASAVQQRRLIARRAAATQEASNILDRIVGRRWRDLSAGDLRDVALSPDFTRVAPGAQLTADVAEVPGRPPAKRVRVSIAWKNLAGLGEMPVTLFAWKYSEAVSP